MSKAIVTPCWTWLYGITPEQARILDRAFAVPIPGIKFHAQTRKLILAGRWDGCHHFFNRTESRIATGLLPKLLKIMPGLEVEDGSLDEYGADWERAKLQARTVELNGITLTDIQRAAIISAVENRRGILKLPTNFGKSEVLLAVAKAFGLPTLWLLHRKDLLHQSAERAELRLGLPAGKIGDGMRTTGALVTVGMMQSIQPRRAEWKEELKRYKVLVCDEAHHLSSTTQQQIAMACEAPFRYALGGSFPADQLKMLKIMAATDCTLLYEVQNKELIESGWSAHPDIFVCKAAFNDCDQLDYRQAYEQTVVRNDAYHEAVVSEVEKRYAQGKSVLVLVDRLAQGGSIGRKLGGKKIDYEFLTGSHDSMQRIAKLAEFKQGRLPVIVATSIFDEGVDVPRVQALVLAAGGKSSVRLLQRVGRALRNKRAFGENVAEIVDFYHTGSRYLEKHSKLRLKVYAREQFKVTNSAEYDLRTVAE